MFASVVCAPSQGASEHQHANVDGRQRLPALSSNKHCRNNTKMSSSSSSCSAGAFEHAFAAWADRSQHSGQSAENPLSSSSSDALRLESAVMADKLCNLNLKLEDCHFLLTCPTGNSESAYFMKLQNANELDHLRVAAIQAALASINEYAMESSHLEFSTMLDKIHSCLAKVSTSSNVKKRKVEEHPVILDTEKPKKQKQATESVVPSTWPQTSGAATRCLTRNLQNTHASDTKTNGYEVCVDPENLYFWKVKLFGFPEDEPIGEDMKRGGVDHILMHMRFSGDFPFAPPRCNIIRPRIQKRTGWVVGGVLCMELLTRAGWSPAYSVDALIIQIRATLLDGKARLDLTNQSDYEEAHTMKRHDSIEALHRRVGWGRLPKA
eukprot:GILK01008808.1.p1 GENE.GILK01008808.1~~GILK01008808.1.p1  ORF type:complete len:380 (-),score=36.33 GILK01008808.1:226-1365(-)